MWRRIFQTEVPASMRPRGGSRFGVSEEETDSEGVWSRGPEEQNGQRVVCGMRGGGGGSGCRVVQLVGV